MGPSARGLWTRLEQWSAPVFLTAGGLWLVAILLSAAEAVIAGSLQAPSSVAAFTGTVLTFVGLLGLYPRLSSRAPRLARVGVVLVSLPLVFTAVLLVWHVPELFIPDWPTLLVYLPSPIAAYGATFVLSAVGITVFGVGSVRTDALPRPTGWLLFLVAAAWFFLIGAAASYGFPIPDWVADVQGVLMVVALLPLGYLLRWGDAGRSEVEPAREPVSHD